MEFQGLDFNPEDLSNHHRPEPPLQSQESPRGFPK